MTTIAIPRVSDNLLLQVFMNDVLFQYEELGMDSTSTVTVSIARNSSTVQAVNGANDDGSLKDEFLESLRSSTNTSCAIESIVVRDPTKNDSSITYKRSTESLIDQLSTAANKRLPVEMLAVYTRLQTKLQMSIGSASIGEMQSDVFGAHHEVLTKLEGLNATLIDKQHEKVRALDAEKSSYLDQKNEEFASKNETLEADYAAKQQKLEGEHEARSEELHARAKLIEDADNTTARRKTTTSMLEDVQEKAKYFNFSSSVTLRSLWAIVLAALLLVAGGFGSYISALELKELHYEYPSSKTLQTESGYREVSEDTVKAQKTAIMESNYVWFLYLRAFLSSALFISSALYMIKWFNSWANRIAQQELENQQFVRDLNRAHLAVEMCLEWNEKKDGNIPERLLDSLTEGLFKDKAQPNHEILHPAEQLASALIRSSDSIKLPIGSSELDVNGKKLSKQKPPKSTPPEIEK
ncbi:hypothetical protein L8R80_18675 [Vibrio splendidus]|uniref:hypothetical protein n=1 Tax=Vibrio splendidus TaxID=29497 RepID=UPI002468607E|nr:hypothetical protein [Vibrio splendidus]MDH5914438.1 hypothetical protein [Vibrio splendidus]MDH5943508.1 hypothetical protein [Vibrio splendidus]MDH5985158.1 hypothetical protein [Vibrio splendidus]MDH5995257.1 hypothetical protein [Vibrio splendidus]MDH6006751.1 hypothetical protein [Vibrio splendidus]